MTRSHITTHVLDTSRGRPAAGIAARLEVQSPDGWREIGSGVTDTDGRITALGPAQVAAGHYRLEFDVSAYYGQHGVDAFFSSLRLSFTLREPTEHYHVPVLLGPYAISTYRGS